MGVRHSGGFAAIIERGERESSRRLADKVPGWRELAPELVIPSSLNLEQCSSGAAAGYKAGLARSCAVKRTVDLTGGLGVDSWALSRECEAVLHNERDVVLSTAVRENFAKLGATGVRFSNFDIDVPGGAEECPWIESVREFRPDMIYADPSRRDGCGRKVFLPSDCSPDIVALMPHLLDLASLVMVKFSPMMDISALRDCFGWLLKQLHIVCVGGEVKELLCLFSSRLELKPGLFVANGSESLMMEFDSEQTAAASYSQKDIAGYGFLFEPGAGLMKAGAFKYISSRYGLAKTGRSTHLYLCDSVDEGLRPFGKYFRIIDALPFGKDAFARIATLYPHADITARNLPLCTDELRRRIKITPGPNGSGVHIFGLSADSGFVSGRHLIICQAAI